ncbi:MAG: OmpA family protein [Gammaproteobacteria bacterium]|nr:OmpA family protein [Gammaproteobacteria bacterium]
MLKRLLVSILLLASLSVAGIAQASEQHGFYNKSSDMVEALSGKKNLGKKRSLFGGGDTTRSLKRKKKVAVMKMDEQSGKYAETIYETGHELGNANLKVEFDFNSANIRSESHALLKELAQALKSNALAKKQFTIAGHTDTTGDDAYNMQLSVKRAQAVKKYLVAQHGVASAKLKVLGFGETMPVVTNDSKKNRQLNRRVEVLSK